MNPNNIHTTPQNIAAQVAACIVTNHFNSKLEEIVNVLQSCVSEIWIGYDGTLQAIPASFSKKHINVIQIKWQGFSATKNYVAAQANADWILSLDSDEMPDEALLKSLEALPYNDLSIHNLYALKRISYFEGKKILHGSWGRDKVLRLYNKKTTQWNQDIVHEDVERSAQSNIILLNGILLHYTADNFQTFLAKNKRYAQLSAEKYYQKGKRATIIKRFVSPLFSFIKEYVFQAGFLDGKAGFNIAWINAKYTFWKYKFLKEKQET